MLKYECLKILKSWKIMLVFLLSLGAFCRLTSARLPVFVDFAKSVYAEYIDIVEGVQSTEKSEYMERERARLDRVLSSQGEVEQKYAEGKITFDEFSAYNSELIYAETQNDAFTYLYNKYLYFQTQPAAQYFYDIEWQAFLLDFKPEMLFLFMLAIIIPLFYELENRRGLSAVLRSLPNGRQRLRLTKFAVIMAFAALTAAIFTAADICFFISEHGTQGMNMPAVSMECFAGCSKNITVLEFLILISHVRLLYYLVATGVICLICKFSRNTMSNIFLSATATAVPVLLSENLPAVLRHLVIPYEAAITSSTFPLTLGCACVIAVIGTVCVRVDRA